MPIISNDPNPDLGMVKREVQQYSALKDEIANLDTRLGTLKKRIISAVEALGSPNEKGSIILPLQDSDSGITAIVKQRRVSKLFNEARADEILKGKGLYDVCVKTTTVLDEDAVMAAYFNGELTDDDINQMFPEKETWALVMEKK